MACLSHTVFYACPNLDLKLLMSASQSLFVLVASTVTTSCHSYSHVPSFVSALLSHVPSFVSVLLSHVPCFVSASLTPFLFSPMCLSCLVTILALSASHRSYVVSVVLLPHVPSVALSGSASRCSLMCFALSQHHAAHVPCLVSACHHTALQCSALSRLLASIYCSTRYRKKVVQ